MAGAIFSDINPAVTSGNDLADLLNDFKDIIRSGFSGTTRPTNLDAGGTWIDTTISTAWAVKLFDGVDDITVYTVDPTTNTVSIAGATGTFSLTQVSADAVGPILSFLKKRIATNGQTLVGDVLGEAQFKSTDNTGAAAVSFKMKVVSNNNTTSGQAGAYLVLEQMNTNSASLLEKMRIVDGKVGIGTPSPLASVHTKNSLADGVYAENEADSTASATHTFKKRRSSGGGQVLSGDFLGISNYNTTDSSGADYTPASIEFSASENHTSANQGTKFELKITPKLSNVKTAIMTYIDRLQFLLGFQTKDIIVGTNGTMASNAKLNRSAAGVIQLLLGNDSTAEGTLATTGFGQLGFKFETFTFAGKPAAGNAGRVIYSSDTQQILYDNGTIWVDVGGGGVTNAQAEWVDSDVSPLPAQDARYNQVRNFEAGLSQKLHTMIKVPASYISGTQIKATVPVSNGNTSGTILMKTISTLVRNGQDSINSVVNQRTSTNSAITMNAGLTSTPQAVVFDLTDSTGQINGVSVSANDIILVDLYRDTDTAISDISVYDKSSEITFK